MHITIWNGKKALVHLEIQSKADANMEQRLLEYNVLAYRRYKCPIVSYVIYLRKGGKIPQSPLTRAMSDGKEILRFHYEVILVWNTPYKELLNKGLLGMLPLVPLAQDGAKPEVVEQVIARLLPAHDTINKDLLALTSLFASLAFKRPEDQMWLKRRYAMLEDILRETPMYKHLEKTYLKRGLEQGLEKGLEQGLKQGLEKGREEGRILYSRKLLLAILQQRFPQLYALAQNKISSIEQPELLESLTLKINLAQTVEEVEQYLLQAN